MHAAIRDVQQQGRMRPLNTPGPRIIKRQNSRFSRAETGAKERISLSFSFSFSLSLFLCFSLSLFLLLRATKTTLLVIKWSSFRWKTCAGRDDVSDNAFCHRELVTNFDNNCIASASSPVTCAPQTGTFIPSAALIINMCG